MLPNNANLEARYRTMLILWFALLMCIPMYLLVTLTSPWPEATENKVLAILFTAVAVVLVGSSFVVKKKFLNRAIDQQQVELVQTALVLAASFCEAATLLGLLDFYVARDRYFFVLFAIGFLGMLLHFPRRSDLEAASFKSRSGLS